MSRLDEVQKRRQLEAERIEKSMAKMAEEKAESVGEGELFVAFVDIDNCIGCDQCMIVCDDKAIELYDLPLRTTGLESENITRAMYWMPPVCFSLPDQCNNND
jgi:NAD-dependent dihydropyrimidine dehydrogenase PreA subunit